MTGKQLSVKDVQVCSSSVSSSPSLCVCCLELSPLHLSPQTLSTSQVVALWASTFLPSFASPFSLPLILLPLPSPNLPF